MVLGFESLPGSLLISMDTKEKKIFGLSRNVVWLGIVSFFNDLSSEMIFPFLPIFLKNYLGASNIFIGLIEGLADSVASLWRIFSGRWSDQTDTRKPFIVAGYSLSALAKPLLALAQAPWHALIIRFIDRTGKGTREAPRDALISFSTARETIGRAFGFHRGLDTLGGALGPLVAFIVLPLLDNNLRSLFLFSFVASFFAVFCLVFFVREIKKPVNNFNGSKLKIPSSFKLKNLGWPFLIFTIVATIFSLGKASEAFLLLRAENLGLAIVLLPIIYLVYNLSYSFFSTPAGILSDKIGHRKTFLIGIFIFAISYIFLARVESLSFVWLIFAFYGLYSAFTDGVGRAIVADLVNEENRGLAYGIYNAATGIALLPASVIFGLLWDKISVAAAFNYGAVMAAIAILFFLIFFRTKDKKISQYQRA